MEKVSIIIPTYKGEQNILIAVQSALRTKGVTKEIIVVDDNGLYSEHQIKTYSLLKPYIDTKMINYIPHKTNINGSAARNTGFQNSSGDYIVFLDDDDYLFPNKIVKQVRQLSKFGEEIGFSVSGGFYVHKNGRGYIKRLPSVKNALFNYLIDKYYFNTSALVIRRSIIEKLNGFDETFNRHQDWEFCSRMMSITKPCFINEPLFIKYAENRNTAANINIRENQLDYFLNKIIPIWKLKLSNNQIRKIIKYRYRQVFQACFMSKQLKNGILYLKRKKCSKKDAFYAILELVILAMKRLILGNKKVTYSYDEVQIKLDLKREIRNEYN